MPFVVKSHLRPLQAARAPRTQFTEWGYENARPHTGANLAWFTPETSGGLGLYALGFVATDAAGAGKNAKGNRLVSFEAEFHAFDPVEGLGKADFATLPRVGEGSPMQQLNRLLYINSHLKVAEIDAQTFEFLFRRFREYV